jgi:Uncharacterized protein conserved in bacteria
MNLFNLVVKSTMAMAVSVCTITYAHAGYRVPTDSAVLAKMGTCAQTTLPTTFRFFNWNIKKAEFKDQWAKDFSQFVGSSDLVFVQEAMIDGYMPSIVKEQKGFCWDFAASFLYDNDDATGVLSGATATPARVIFARSPGREPLVGTPKMTLVTEYFLAGTDKTLMVANIHALNAASNVLNRAQVVEVLKVLSTHTGPMIFSGDFNSWNPARIQYLDQLMGEVGMKKIAFPVDNRRLKLDHIYSRGLDVVQSELHRSIESSDHKPLTATLRLAN